MIARSAAARAAASVVLAGALLVGTTGCTFISTQATLIQYEPSDGVGTRIGNVEVRNVIALINDDSTALSLMVTFVNSGDRSANLKIQYQSAGEKTTITKPLDANEVTSYGTTPEGSQIIVADPGVEAGQLFPVYLQYGDHEGVQLMVPVLNADNHPEYADLIPASAQ